MPTYTYKCTECNLKVTLFHGIRETFTTCEVCGQPVRKVWDNANVGIVYKGTGFYTNDYKRDWGDDLD